MQVRPCIVLVGVAGRSHVPMEKAAFEGWLESVSAIFLTLNDQQRNQSLDHLISLSGAVQLRHLSNGLETLLKRDFLRLLPLELAFYLLRWLDPQTLLTCCLVCKQWNKVNSHNGEVMVCFSFVSHGLPLLRCFLTSVALFRLQASPTYFSNQIF